MAYLSYTQGFPGIADVFLRDQALYAPLLQFIIGKTLAGAGYAPLIETALKRAS
jgi:hypothetical protein